METDRGERKNKRVAMAISIGLHSGIGVLLFFLAAWRAPDPPNPEFGIELNFGMDAQGAGEIQPDQPVGNQDQMEDNPVDQLPDQQEEKAEVESEPVKEQEVVSEVESPVVVKVEKKKEPVVSEVKKDPEPIKKKEIVKEAIYNPDETLKETEKGKKGKNQSQGDNKNVSGDKGNPEGKIDANALYGNPGGGNNGLGSGLDLSGWKWDSQPNPKLPENEKNGKLVFEIEVDENGEIIKLIPLERSLSPQAEKICREEILRLSFSPTGSNVPAISKGKITFIVKAQ